MPSAERASSVQTAVVTRQRTFKVARIEHTVQQIKRTVVIPSIYFGFAEIKQIMLFATVPNTHQQQTPRTTTESTGFIVGRKFPKHAFQTERGPTKRRGK